ncbi:MAG: hypothetical protein JWO38_4668, partial [Gemmataceae bacterium]|nr:hypothetical protein [Gemmataceae bacterium]
LFGVARRVATAARRREDRRARLVRRAAGDVTPPNQPPGWDDLLATLDEELARLPDKYRAPLLACYLDGRTQDEAARQLGWSVSTLRRRLEAARDRLRVRMTARGATLGGGLIAGVLVPATAAVPEPLARAAVESAAGGSSSARVLELAAGSVSVVKWVLSTTVLLVAAGLAVGIGTGREGPRPDPPPPADRHPLVVATDPPAEPLPPGAVARMGSLRFRHSGWVPKLEFALGGKVLVSCGSGVAGIWNARTGELVRTLGSKHGDEKAETVVNAVGVSADGRTLIVNADRWIDRRSSTSRSFTWDLERDAEDRTFTVVQDRARETPFMGPQLFAPDESRMAELDNQDGSIWLWGKDGNPTGRLARAVGDPSETRSRLAVFSPDGKTLYSTLPDHTIKVWDTTTGKLTRSFGTGKSRPSALAVSADGKYIATFASLVPKRGEEWQQIPEAVRVWDPAKGDRLAEIAWDKSVPKQDSTQYNQFVGFLPDGTLWAVATSDAEITFRQWDRETGRQTREWVSPVLGRQPVGVALSPDGSRLATGSRSGLIEIFDAETGKNLSPGGGHLAEINGLRFTPDGKHLVTASHDHTIRTWDAVTGKELRVLSGLGIVGPLSADARLVFDFRYRQGQPDVHDLIAIDAVTGREVWTFPEEAEFVHPGSDPKNLWVSLKGYKSIAQLDPASGKVVRSRPITTSSVLFGDGGRLAISWDKNQCNGWDVATGQKRFSWDPRETGLFRTGTRLNQEFKDGVDASAVSQDGKYLAVVVGRNPSIRRVPPVQDDLSSFALCETATGKIIWQVRSDTGFRRSTAFSPDGKYVAVAGEAKAWLFDTTTGKELGTFDGHRSYTTVVEFSPDGKQLATGGADGTAVVWDLPRR